MTSMAEINAVTGLRAKLQQERIGAITSGARIAINSFLGVQSNILQMAEEILSLDERKLSEDGKPEDSEDLKHDTNPYNKNPKKNPKKNNKNNNKGNNQDGNGNGQKFSGSKRLREEKPTENGNLPGKNILPKNCARKGAKHREAFRKAKRDHNVPQGQEPVVGPNIGRRGQKIPGKAFKLKDANNHEVIIRDDVEGHIFKDGGKLPKHLNVGDDHYFYE